MSILSDRDICELGSTIVSPFDKEMVQPASIDVTLDDKFYVMKHPKDPKEAIIPSLPNDDFFEAVEADGVLVLDPGAFVLGSTYEKFHIPNFLAGNFEGKSSIGRLGLLVHATAGFIDPGFEGNITVEIYNLTNRRWALIPGMKIGQICFRELKSQPENLYGDSSIGSHYQSQSGPTLSRSHKNFYTHPIRKGI